MTQANPHRAKVFLRNLLIVMLAVTIFGHAADSARAADANLWTVTGISGKVRVLAAGGTWSDLDKGVILKPGYRVETGHNGRVSLVRPGHTVTVNHGPRGQLHLTGGTDSGGKTDNRGVGSVATARFPAQRVVARENIACLNTPPMKKVA